MYWIVEGWRGWRFWIVFRRAFSLGRGEHDFIGRPLAVGAPVPLVHARVGVEHDHAVVAIAVRHVDFVDRCIDPDVGRHAELACLLVAFARSVLADLHNELAVARGLDDEAVVAMVAAEPDKIARDADAVRPLRHLEGGARTAPSLHDVAVGIEFDYRRGRNAAFRDRRTGGR